MAKILKRVVIKEEFVAITGDFISAIVLNQFLYWSDRVNDYDKMLQEEKMIAAKERVKLNILPKQGWIYKKAEDLIEETMINVSANYMRKKIKVLIDKGYLFVRKNPCYKWDHTNQYRVNFQKIIEDLNKQGYHLNGYKISDSLPTNGENTETHEVSFGVTQGEFHNARGEFHNARGEFHNARGEEQYQRIQLENTSENTSSFSLYDETKKNTVSEPQCAQNPPSGNGAKNNARPSVPKSDRVESKHTNALSADNLNALSTGNYIYDETNVPSQKGDSKYEEFFEEIWETLKPNKNDRKDKVSMSRKKALYKMGAERVKKAIKVYLATQDEKYMHKRDNILNFVIDNYLDKEISDFKQPNQTSKQNPPPEDYDYSDFAEIGFCF